MGDTVLNTTVKEKDIVLTISAYMKDSEQEGYSYTRKSSEENNQQITKLRTISYEMFLKECGLTTVETRRLRGGQIDVFIMLNGYENIDKYIFVSVKEERRTRGNGKTLAKKQYRLDIRKVSFSQRTIN